jgi:integrase
MPKLTTAAVTKYVALPNQRREIRDTQAPSLYLIIQPKPKGTKSWALRFRRPNGQPAKLTLGRVDLSDVETVDAPTLGGALTLRQARQLANQIDRERARGIDVVEQAKADKSRKAAAVVTAAANTFAKAAIEFFADHKTKHGRPRRWRGDARLLGLDWPIGADPASVTPTIIPGSLVVTWADRPVTEIDGHDIHSVVDDARKRGIPGLKRRNRDVSDARGRKMHSGLCNLFRWLFQHRRVTANPAVGVWHPGPPPSRERVLNEAELKSFWQAAGKARAPYGLIFKLLLLTGARLNEVAGMRRAELSEDGATWTIPGTRTKNHRTHLLPLPPLARELIEVDPKSSPENFLFVNGNGPLKSWARPKAELDAAMGAPAPWRLHDLRRTAATGMADLGILPHVIEEVLNHASGFKGGVAGTYNRAAYAAEKAAALERWAAHIAGLVSDKPTNVTALRQRRR